VGFALDVGGHGNEVLSGLHASIVAPSAPNQG